MIPRRIETTTSNSKGPAQRVNETIRAPQIRVISEEGAQLGVMTPAEALAQAKKVGLDLVEVAAAAKPPVCRIMDYGKFKYEQKKKIAKQQTNRPQLKELRLRPKTGDHDIQVKINKAREFLVKKDKVLLSIQFRGREMAHISEGEKLLESVLQLLGDVAKVEAPPKQMGKKLLCTLAPR
ncbi:MAG: translation initiation factor IF-3 [Planctomycetia bacterium]|nr:translation initiation factor IF-3 [Planctomycetia bacterium]